MTSRDGLRGPPEPLPRSQLEGDAPRVAPGLLGCLLRVGDRVGRIVEVEAYGGAEDPASHAHRGRTGRNATMFGRAGLLYCYRSYGIHTCANVVTGAEGEGQAVLLRAVEVLGSDEDLAPVRADRPAARRREDIANGPGKLCEALGITLDDDGTDLCGPGSRVGLCSDGAPPRHRVASGPRVGITVATRRPWRFWVEGSPYVSR